jgi:septal ring-binding cell division protein DamX
MKEVRIKKIKMLTAIILFLSVFQLAAKSDIAETIDPPVENNIICFAALNKWVCAPADQQEKAQEKAMQLALKQSHSNNTEISLNDKVEIKTLEPNNIGQQVQEQPIYDSNQNYATDFTPIQDESTEQGLQNDSVENSAVEPEPTEVVTEDVTSQQNTNQQQTAESSSAQVISQYDSAETRAFQLASTNFNEWQSQYPEQWTFQVVGTSNRHHLDQFVKNNSLSQTNHSIVKTQANGADWWVVLTGLYSSREEALSQRHVLPDNLSQGAWVRQIKTIDGYAD